MLKKRKPINRGYDYLQAWRDFRGLNQAVVAAEIGLGGTSLSEKEHGKHPIQLSELMVLAEIYKTDVCSLLKAPPAPGRSEKLHVVNVLIEKMTDAQIDALIAVGEAMAVSG